MRKTLLLLLLVLTACGITDNKILTSDFPQARSSEIIVLESGSVFELEAQNVIKNIGGKPQQLFAFNEQIPGPQIRVAKGASVKITLKNSLSIPLTLHWHGLRWLQSEDGVPHISHKPVLPGESYTYHLQFPDEGMLWYHPHISETIAQDLGLSGVIIVGHTPDAVIVLDDILMQGNTLAPYSETVTHTLMGRFGNVFLINGEEKPTLSFEEGGMKKIAFVNAANARPFNVSFGTPMKLIGGDLSPLTKERIVDSIIIAPGERWTIEVPFEKNSYQLTHSTPLRTINLAEINFKNPSNKPDMTLKKNPELEAELNNFLQKAPSEPDLILDLKVDMQHMMLNSKEEIEWEDTMQGHSSMMTNQMVRWKITDAKTGKSGPDLIIPVSGITKIRLRNKAAHQMHHPIHLHGQRFVVASVDGKQPVDLLWKDTVLVKGGSIVDIIVDATNPGQWMLHCHTLEHAETGMSIMLEVNK